MCLLTAFPALADQKRHLAGNKTGRWIDRTKQLPLADRGRRFVSVMHSDARDAVLREPAS